MGAEAAMNAEATEEVPPSHSSSESGAPSPEPVGPPSDPGAAAFLFDDVETDEEEVFEPSFTRLPSHVDLGEEAWPGNVPSFESALTLLTDPTAVGDRFDDISRTLLEELDPAATQSVFGDEEDPAHPETRLRVAVVARWRLEVARAWAPSDQSHVDEEALAALMTEAADALEGLQAEGIEDEALAAAFANCRATLSRAAVRITELWHEDDAGTEPTRPGVRPKKTKDLPAATGAQAAITRKSKNPHRTRNLLAVGLLAMTAIAAVFHGWRWSQPRAMERDQPYELGTVANSDREEETLLMHQEATDPGSVEAFQRQVAGEGKQAIQVAPNEWIVVPMETPEATP